MDTDSDGDSYGTEPTVFDSDADSDADCNADSGINCDDACEAPAQAWLHEDQDYPPEYYLKQLVEFEESDFTTQDYADGSTNLLNRIEEHWYQ